MVRIHIINTHTRELETPAFFPVNNLGQKGSFNTPRYWEDIPDMNTMMVNAYHISKSSQFSKLKDDGLHKKYSKKGVFFADSGGFQARQYNLSIDPISVLRTQESIGADIISTLDMPVFPDDTIYQTNHSNAIRLSIKNALLLMKNRECEDMKVYATIHGNDIKTMLNMIEYLSKREKFDGFAIGGLVPKRSNFHNLIDLVFAVRKKIGETPLHVFGLGGVSIIPLLSYLGVDTFDSSAFMVAGAKRLFFRPGRGHSEFQNMNELEYLPCVCPICSTKTFDEVRSQRKLIAMHNLWMITAELRTLKEAIEEKDIEPYLDKRFFHNPLIHEGFRYAKMKVRGLV